MKTGSGSLLRTLGAYLAGILLAYLLACVLHSQTVLAGLSSIGVDIPLARRLEMTVHDLLGLWRYGIVIFIAMSLGFFVMFIVSRFARLPPTLLCPLAGFLAFATMLFAMSHCLAFTPLASARHPIGLLLQCSAGAIGGWVAGINLTKWKNFDSISKARAQAH